MPATPASVKKHRREEVSEGGREWEGGSEREGIERK